MPDKSLQEQILELADKQDGIVDDNKPPANEPDQNKGRKPDAAANAANLRKMLEERDERIKSLQGEIEPLKTAAQRAADERYKPIWETLETEYEDDPDRFLNEFKEAREKKQEFDQKLREKEEAIERLHFESSEVYKKNVAEPIFAAEELLKGVVKKDDAIYKKLKANFLYDADKKVRRGPMTADEIIALDEALEGTAFNPSRVQTAIENLREKFHGANEFYSNRKAKLQELEAQKQQEQAARNAEEIRLAKIARAQAVKTGASKLEVDVVKKVFGPEFVREAAKAGLATVEDQIATRRLPSMEDMASNQIKARLFDKLMEDGSLDLLVEALESSENFSNEGDGTRAIRNKNKKQETRSPLEVLTEMAGPGADRLR